MKKLIDTHLHIWDFSAAEYDWLKGDTSLLNRTYTIEEVTPHFKNAGVTNAILVQAANNFEDTDHMLHTTAITEGIIGVTGWLPLSDLEETANAWENKYSKNPYFKAVRHLMHDEPSTEWLIQPNIIESLNYLANNHIPYEIVATQPAHMESTLQLIEKVPHLKIILDHLSQPPMQDAVAFECWTQQMKLAASHPNVYAKISGLGTASKQFNSWNTDTIKPSVEKTLELFGTQRCLLGGDWPVSLLAGNYVDTWKKYQSVLNELITTENDLDNIYYNNAQAFYNL